MTVSFEAPMSYSSSYACRRLLACLETQKFLYTIVRGIKEKEYREIHVRVTYPATADFSVSKGDGEGGIHSLLSVSDIKGEFVEGGKVYPLSPDVALHHVRGLLWRFLSWENGLPWEFEGVVSKGFLFFSRKEKRVGDFHGAKKKWDMFLGEEIR